MPSEDYYLDISLLGKEYRVACPPQEHEALLAAVAYVDAKMHDIAGKTKNNIAERIAVMAALNIAHEHLSHPRQIPGSGDETPAAAEGDTGLDFGTVRRRISAMEEKLDAVLAPQDSLL